MVLRVIMELERYLTESNRYYDDDEVYRIIRRLLPSWHVLRVVGGDDLYYSNGCQHRCRFITNGNIQYSIWYWAYDPFYDQYRD